MHPCASNNLLHTSHPNAHTYAHSQDPNYGRLSLAKERISLNMARSSLSGVLGKHHEAHAFEMPAFAEEDDN